MLLSGFKCPKMAGGKTNFDFCHNSCKDRCRPLPLLLALAQEGRVTENVYHVTEIPNPPQVVYLKRNFPYYSSPDDFAFMMFGTAVHSVVESQAGKLKELGVADDYVQEGSFQTTFEELPGVVLRGRADLYIKSERRLIDFKTMKFYYDIQKILVEGQDVEKVKPDMVFQLNAYRTFGFPEAEHLEIEALVKDHSRKIKKMYGVPAIVNFEIPIWPADKTRKMTVDYLRTHIETQASGSPRLCTDEERWYNPKSREYIRCLDYCPVNDICPQWIQEQEDKKR